MTLDEFEQLEKSATHGPWKWRQEEDERYSAMFGADDIQRVFDDGSACGEYSAAIVESDDTRLIATSRNIAPEVIALMRAAKAYLTLSDAKHERRPEYSSPDHYEAWKQLHKAIPAFERKLGEQ